MSILVSGSNRLAIITLIIFSMTTVACADVSCSISLTNSDGSTSDSVTVSNANYNSVSVLLPGDNWGGLPYSILSKGSGESTSSSGKFSESVSVKGGSYPGEMSADTKTFSGAFSWSKNVNIGSVNPDTSMDVYSSIANGVLDSSYTNSYSSAHKEISIANSEYSDHTQIKPQLVLSAGAGESTNVIGNGFGSHLVAETLDKKGVMDTGLSERFDAGAHNKWVDKIALTPISGSMDQSVTVFSNNECHLEDDQLGTAGQIQTGMTFTPYYRRTGAQAFETQTVPGTNAWPLTILVIPRVSQEEPSYYDFKTLEMSSYWPV